MAAKKTHSWEPFRFFQEQKLLENLQTLLHADLLEPVFKKSQYQEEKDYWKSIYEGQSFRISPSLAPNYFNLCREVLDTLRFEEPVDFYITSDANINAASYLRQSETHSHLVVFNSGLVENFSDMEFRFVVGHELGHIIFKASHFRRLISHIFPQQEDLPLAINNLLRLWDKFAEISADRMGFIAAPDLKSCVTAFFKLSSGLSLDKINFNFENYLEEVKKTLENYSPHQGLFYSSHPANPIRIKAIEAFKDSKLYKNFVQKGTIKEDLDFQKEMEELSHLMELHPDNERDHYRLLVVAAGGMVMAGIDGDVSPEEEDRIIHFLSQFTVYPRKFLDNILKENKSIEDIRTSFMENLKKLLDIDPSERYAVFSFLSQIALSDRILKKVELDFLMDFGQNVLGFHEMEACREFVGILRQERFMPRL